MSATGDIGERLDRIEQALRGLQAELAEIRGSVATPAPDAAVGHEGHAPAAPSGLALWAAESADDLGAPVSLPSIAAAWRALERGRDLEAVVHAEAAFARATEEGDADGLRAVAAFADAAASHVVDPALASRVAGLRPAAADAGAGRPPAPSAPAPEPRATAVEPRAEAPAPRPRAAVVEPQTPTAPRPAEPSRPHAAARVGAWAQRELTGSRLFALGGGVLMLLGVVFLFVVAANRGWVGPGDRVALGAVASLGVLLVGLVLRSRYGRLQASLAAVGVGIAGAYATLAAATILYGFVPSWAALLLAAGIASVGGAIALAWSSQLLAGLALVGAAAAPGLVALDDGISAPAPAFALVVLAATIVSAAPRRWLWLVVAVGATALPQVVWLVADSPHEDRGAIAVSAAASLVLLAGALVWQSSSAADSDSSAATMALLGAGIAFGAARRLFPDSHDEGIALAVMAAIYGVVAIAAGRRWRDLGWVVGAASLLLAAVATADLLSGRSLTVVLAVEAVVLACLAWRLESPRFELSALTYLALGIAHAGIVDLEGALEAGDVPRAAAPALFSLAAASLAVALLLPRWASDVASEPPPRPDAASTGIGAALEPLWDGLGRHRAWIRAVLVSFAIALAAAGSAGILSGRWLTIVWAAAAAAGGLVAWRRGSPGVALVALSYLALGTAHVGAVELEGLGEAGDVSRAAAPALFSLAAAALVVGLLLPVRHAGDASRGMAKTFAPLWDGLVRERAWIRAVLVALAIALAATGSAGVLSGRWLTILWAAAAAAGGVAALAARERRLVAVALPWLALGILHALSVEAPVSTLALDRGLDPLSPVPSLVALGAACLVLALTCLFEQRDIRFLGPLSGPEPPLAALDGEDGRVLRATLLHVASGYAVWAVGLVLIDLSYEWGQVGATSLWAALGAVVVARSAAIGSRAEIAGWAVLAFGYAKSVAFDWFELGPTPASTSLLAASAALLAAGFASRWLDTRPAEGRELLSLFVAAVASVSAVLALGRLVDDEQAFGAGLLVVAVVFAGVAIPPYRRWHRDGRPTWARTLATGYWVLGLAILLLAESALTGFGTTNTLTLWSVTATGLALGRRPIGEPRLWVAALVIAMASTAAVIVAVTPPDRLVDASTHPAEGFSALAALVVAAAAVAWAPPSFAGELQAWLTGWAAAVGLFAVSLAVLEIAERVSGASVETDFQRGHTALSTLLGLGALAVYVVGLARDRRSVRLAGLTLFGLALAKLFLYDLSSLSSITRALSFLALGAVLLAAAFFAERAVRGDRGGPGGHAGPRTA